MFGLLMCLGFLSVLLGLFLWSVGDAKYRVSVLITLAGSIYIAYEYATGFPKHANFLPGEIITGLGLFLQFLFLALEGARDKQAAEDARAVAKLKAAKKAFYDECINYGITDCKTEKERQKAILLAQKYSLKYTNDIADMYMFVKREIEKENELRKEKEYEATRAKYQEYCDRDKRYLQYEGIDKRIAMLSQSIANMERKLETVSAGTSALMAAVPQEKEIDWAVRGGIANGIAGPGAGVAAAIDAQSKNAQIRANNKARMDAASPLIMASIGSESSLRSSIAKDRKAIEEAKTKLVSMENGKDLFNHLLFSDEKYEVMECGVLHCSARVKLSESVYIFDDVEAVVDGFLTVKVIHNDKAIAATTVVMPTMGIGSSSSYISCYVMNIKDVSESKEYKLEFSYKKLWAVEE